MVHNRKGDENLYIPHAIDVFGLFRPPLELREKLNACQLKTHDYTFPGDFSFKYIQYCDLRHLNIGDWQGRYDLKYGPYYVREKPQYVGLDARLQPGFAGFKPNVVWVDAASLDRVSSLTVPAKPFNVIKISHDGT